MLNKRVTTVNEKSAKIFWMVFILFLFPIDFELGTDWSKISFPFVINKYQQIFYLLRQTKQR